MGQANQPSSEGNALSKDEIFDVLSNNRRRYVLQYLNDRADSTATMDTLVDYVAAREYSTTPEEIESEERKRVYVGLKQSHIPKLADLDIVTIDDNGNQVTLADNAGEVLPYITRDPSRDLFWSRVYVLFAIGTLAIVILYFLNISPIADVTPSILALGTAVAFLSLAVIHWLRTVATSKSFPND